MGNASGTFQYAPQQIRDQPCIFAMPTTRCYYRTYFPTSFGEWNMYLIQRNLKMANLITSGNNRGLRTQPCRTPSVIGNRSLRPKIADNFTMLSVARPLYNPKQMLKQFLLKQGCPQRWPTFPVKRIGQFQADAAHRKTGCHSFVPQNLR